MGAYFQGYNIDKIDDETLDMALDGINGTLRVKDKGITNNKLNLAVLSVTLSDDFTTDSTDDTEVPGYSININEDGKYLVFLCCAFTAEPHTNDNYVEALINLYKNDTMIARHPQGAELDESNTSHRFRGSVCLVKVVECVTNDVLKVKVASWSSNTNITVEGYMSYMLAIKIG